MNSARSPALSAEASQLADCGPETNDPIRGDDSFEREQIAAFERLARDMQEENLPRQFVETIPTAWWTTGPEVLPARRGVWAGTDRPRRALRSRGY